MQSSWPNYIEIVAAALFAIAVAHTFSVKLFARLARRDTAHAGLWHLLAEVETAFGFWALALIVFMSATVGKDAAVAYLQGRSFTEPLFVFAVMVVAASRPILGLVQRLVGTFARRAPLPSGITVYWLSLTAIPLLGSFITEPAAMTLSALLLRDLYLRRIRSSAFQYATLGVLFVNVSIGGVLTAYAAPAVLMVAGPWGWDSAYMFGHFGWKAMLAVAINGSVATLMFRRMLRDVSVDGVRGQSSRTPAGITLVHVAFLYAIVAFSHHAAVFLGLFLFFLGFCDAYKRHQDNLILREGLMVAFFLAGLVTLGGMQQWWLQPLLQGATPQQVYLGAIALTAVTDNAALTYLGTLVQGSSEAFRQMLVAGAVVGGGLTIIANAPNPAGFAIVRDTFQDGAVSPLRLLAFAAPPTLVAAIIFSL